MYEIVLDSTGAHELEFFESWERVEPSLHGTLRKTLRVLLKLQLCFDGDSGDPEARAEGELEGCGGEQRHSV